MVSPRLLSQRDHGHLRSREGKCYQEELQVCPENTQDFSCIAFISLKNTGNSLLYFKPPA